MGARTLGRESALQMLFALDVLEWGPERAEQAIADYWRETPGDPEGRDYADEIVRGVIGELASLDELLRGASKHWRLERMARVDRNVLRLGAWELRKGTAPRAVVIDEAVELAKRYGAEGSATFVNGVLDRVAEIVGAR